jgi:polysaccharide biosynthesis/export protein
VALDFRQVLVALAVGGMTGACQGGLRTDLPLGAAAQESIALDPQAAAVTASKLRPGDEIGVSVYQEPDLTVARTAIDSAGNVSLPLIGQVRAGGLSTQELALEIQRAYGGQFIRNPRTNVVLLEATPRVVSVEGEVRKPGIYAVDGNYTLLSALALAGSPTETARLNQVLVFRTINGQRAGARFDIKDIRGGRSPDPQVYAGDVIVVGFSTARGAFRDFLQTTPLFGIFTRF